MPELPEVETIRQGLEKYLRGHKIVDVEIKTPKIFSGDRSKALGTRIIGIRRFAKVLSIDLSNGYSIVVHIKLTGQLIYRGPNLKEVPGLSQKVVGGVPGKHTHVVFSLDKGGKLYYNDYRKFGWIKVVETEKVRETEFIKKLGPEPLVVPQQARGSSGQTVLTLDLFKQILLKSSRPIKLILMDQEKIGGVGNIYANDALWSAKINPKKRSSELSDQKTKQLYEAILKVLKEGLRRGGASELAYVTPDGREGEYQNHTLAYGHEGDICKRCHKGRIKKFFLGGRGTYFCPVCQK